MAVFRMHSSETGRSRFAPLPWTARLFKKRRRKIRPERRSPPRQLAFDAQRLIMRTLPLSGAPVAVNALLSPTRRVTLYGPGADYLGLRYAAEAACGRDQVIFICGDNRFDPY